MRFLFNVIIVSATSFFDLHYEIQDFHGIFAFFKQIFVDNRFSLHHSHQDNCLLTVIFLI